MIQEKPANGFDTRVLIKDPDTLFTCPAWARFTDGSDFVETIQIRRDGDFSGLIRRVHRASRLAGNTSISTGTARRSRRGSLSCGGAGTENVANDGPSPGGVGPRRWG